VGITGGIGSGKTLVAKIFATLGIPIYNADEQTKKLMNSNDAIKDELILAFGNETYIDNQLNKKYLSNIVFNNKEKLNTLNEIVHPHSIADAKQWALNQHSKYVIKEAALLFESIAFHDMDYIIGVTAPETIRIHRVMQRDHITANEVKARMSNQIADSIKMKLCNAVIYNDEKQLLIPQVVHLHQQFISI
jgi:dephospho-CoA kinase